MFCPRCGIRLLTGGCFCQDCGAQVDSQAGVRAKCGARLTKPEKTKTSTRSRLATTLLALFLGIFGAHRFYAGKIETAIVMVILGLIGFSTLWVLGIALIFLIPISTWAFVDFICSIGCCKDDMGLPIDEWQPCDLRPILEETAPCTLFIPGRAIYQGIDKWF